MKSSVLVFGDSITFPYGATEGRRIEIDGVNGTIKSFSEDGNLVLEIEDDIHLFSTFGSVILDGSGLRVADDVTGAFIDLLLNAPAGPVLAMKGEDVPGHDLNAATVFAVRGSGPEFVPQLQMNSGTIDTGDATTLFLDGEGAAGQLPKAVLQLGAGLAVFFFDTDRFFASDAWIESNEDVRVNGVSLPRGERDYAEQPNNTALSVTAGTYTTIVTGAAFTPVAGRKYGLKFFGGDDLLINGTGLATTNEWKGKFQVSVNGGAFADVSGPTQLARLEVAAATRKPVATQTDRYVALSTDSLQFRYQVAKTNGAATVTSSMETLGVTPWKLQVEDIGA